MHHFYKACCSKQGVIFGSGVESKYADFPESIRCACCCRVSKDTSLQSSVFKQSGHEKKETLEQNHRKQNSIDSTFGDSTVTSLLFHTSLSACLAMF